MHSVRYIFRIIHVEDPGLCTVQVKLNKSAQKEVTVW